MPHYVLVKFPPSEKCPYGDHGVVDVNIAFQNPKMAKIAGKMVNQCAVVMCNGKAYPGTKIMEYGMLLITNHNY